MKFRLQLMLFVIYRMLTVIVIYNLKTNKISPIRNCFFPIYQYKAILFPSLHHFTLFVKISHSKKSTGKRSKKYLAYLINRVLVNFVFTIRNFVVSRFQIRGINIISYTKFLKVTIRSSKYLLNNVDNLSICTYGSYVYFFFGRFY